MNQSKACNQCKQIKPLDEFYARSKTSDAKMAVCKECKDAYSRTYQEKLPKKIKPVIPTRQCDACHKSYSPSRAWQRFCSYECGYGFNNRTNSPKKANTNLCARCGKSLLGKKITALYCSRTCLSMDHSFKYRGTEADRVTIARRRLIIERDNSTCYLCKNIISLDFIEIDHLIPRSREGTSAPSNLSVTCKDCNRGRGNRIGIEQLFRLYELRASDDH